MTTSPNSKLTKPGDDHGANETGQLKSQGHPLPFQHHLRIQSRNRARCERRATGPWNSLPDGRIGFGGTGARSAVLLSTVAPRADNPYDRTDDRHNTENHKLDCVEGSNKPVPRPLRRDCDVDFDRNG